MPPGTGWTRPPQAGDPCFITQSVQPDGHLVQIGDTYQAAQWRSESTIAQTTFPLQPSGVYVPQ